MHAQDQVSKVKYIFPLRIIYLEFRFHCQLVAFHYYSQTDKLEENWLKFLRKCQFGKRSTKIVLIVPSVTHNCLN